MILVEQIVELAEEIEIGDPIDWGMLDVSEHEAYMLIAPSVLENFNLTEVKHRDIMMLATIVKLTVENFALNLTLLQQG